VVQKWAFRPAEAAHCTGRREIWQEEQTYGLLPPRAIFHVYTGIQPPKPSTFAHVAQLYKILSICMRLGSLAFLLWSLLGTDSQVISIFPQIFNSPWL